MFSSRISLLHIAKKLRSTYLRAKHMKAANKNKTAVETDIKAQAPLPAFIEHRQKLWDKLKKEKDDWIATQNRVPIKVILPDWSVKDGQAWDTTPYDIALSISQGLADNTVVAKVNGELWDLDRPFEKDSTLQLLKFEDSEGQRVFWHSSAHILGEAMEQYYGGHLCYGPPIEEGFYYDMYSSQSVSSLEFPNLETLVKNITKDKQPFERLEVSKEDLLKMFEYSEFKQRIIKEKIQTPSTTVYKCGPLIDLCRGPHIRHTGKVKAFSITKNSAAFWEGNSEAERLQRVYGISFPDPKQLKEWKHFQEEAAKRDHRRIGREQELFFFHELSPGSCFFMPKGAHIYNTLIDFIKSEYWQRGFHEVVSPNIYNSKLWEKSGHWQHYAENMFTFECEKETFALKPMNCPGHCLMFDHRVRSWRELPLRFADFGILHRNETSGALSGLTRVRRFQQDDAHIFCRKDQVEEEINKCLDFLKCVYAIFNFTFSLKLSTRPDKFLGERAVWDEAERQLEQSLNDFGHEWELNPGDGAFYGPKIDITISDALRRSYQCATIQLDFQLPEKFDLVYTNDRQEKERPVIIHRAVLGSVERLIAMLCENFGGKWPFWLSPRQSIVVTVAPAFDDYAQKVMKQVHDAGFLCEYDLDQGITMNKKIRNAQLAQYNFIFVVGEKEVANNTANVRTRDNKIHGEHSIDHIIARFQEFKKLKVLDAEDIF
uniref:threonine--tRNA ligase n=1 Tax=Arion vulgaris TaxID=1028688 RepID=A0A0B7AL01_9EUPU